MKYYAVTDDPNELMHYGVKGMKWGEHIFGEDKKSSGSRKRSSGYKNATNKLSKTMQYGINAIKAKWAKAHTPAALRAKAQRKEERFMKRSMQKAREGRLRYGKLTEDQIMKITNRLALEQQARRLGSTEQPKFIRRMHGALQEGMLKGTIEGEAAYMKSMLGAKGAYKAAKKYGKKQARVEARNEAKKEINKDFRKGLSAKEAYLRYRENARNEKDTDHKLEAIAKYGATYGNDGKIQLSNTSAMKKYYKEKHASEDKKSNAIYDAFKNDGLIPKVSNAYKVKRSKQSRLNSSYELFGIGSDGYPVQSRSKRKRRADQSPWIVLK